MSLSGKEKFSYGLGAVGKDMVYMLSASYILYYYQDILGLQATFVGLILMIARVFDAINDPFMGVLVAKTNTKYPALRRFAALRIFSTPTSIPTKSPLLAVLSHSRSAAFLKRASRYILRSSTCG